jgi:molybdopterin-guanine dinucleotide biosynthesis protein A
VKRYRQVAAFILVGGESSRMGQDKCLLDFGGVPLVVRTARLLKPFVRRVTLVGSSSRFGAEGLREIPDQPIHERPSKGNRHGPLAGVVAALADTNSSWNLLLACDLPHISDVWLDWLLSRALQSSAQVVVPRTARGIEPLAAVYRRECAAPLAAAFARGVRKVTDALDGLRLEVLDQNDWRGIDPRGLVMTNMNTPQDYQEALRAGLESSLDEEHLKKLRRARRRKL